MASVTMSGQISTGKSLQITNSEINYQNLVMIDDTVIQLNTRSILAKYMDKLKPYVSKYEFDTESAMKYRFKPTLLSYDRYGTIELAPFILQINNMTSVTEFTNLEKGIFLFNSDIMDFINEVILKEKNEITRNRSNLTKELLSI